MQNESKNPDFTTYRQSHRMLCSRNPYNTTKITYKRTNEVCTQTHSIQNGKSPSEALFFLFFCTSRNCFAAKKFRLCGRRFISLRKAILLLPRKNDRRDGEMLHTNSFSTRFLTVRLLLAAGRSVIETRKRKGSLSF